MAGFIAGCSEGSRKYAVFNPQSKQCEWSGGRPRPPDAPGGPPSCFIVRCSRTMELSRGGGHPMAMANEETAIFGGGCFWCIEAVFQRLRGVKEVVSGYMGGQVENPTYRQVCGGDTGHVEVVRVKFDPNEIAYRDLLEVFFAVHDPPLVKR